MIATERELNAAQNNAYPYVNTLTEKLLALLTQAVKAHQAGQLSEAENLYREILAIDPMQPNANHNLGVLALDAGEASLSLDCFRAALDNDPDEPQFWISYVDALIQAGQTDQAREVLMQGLELGLHGDEVNTLVNQLCESQAAQGEQEIKGSFGEPKVKGNAEIQQAFSLMQSGKIKEAKAKYTRLLKRFPKHPQVLTGLGTIALREGRHVESIRLLEQSLAIEPNQLLALSNLGVAYTNLKRFDEAVIQYEKVIKLDASDADAHFNLANALQGLKQFKSAAERFKVAIALNPKDIEAQLHCGNLLLELGDLQGALTCFNAVIQLNPSSADAYIGRGSVYFKQEKFEEALSDSRFAIQLKPSSPSANLNLSAALYKLGRYEEAVSANKVALKLKTPYALAHYNQGLVLRDMNRLEESLIEHNIAIAQEPEYIAARFSKASLLILKGDIQEGWQQYEWRWKSTPNEYRPFKQAMWLGQASLVGKSFLISTEQGLGDNIQFCRYAPMLEALGAKVFIETPKALMNLMASLPGIHQVVEKDTPLPETDFYCPVMSLPHAFNSDFESIPKAPYLFADEKKQQDWLKKLGPATKPRIGLVCSGSTTHGNDSNRSVPFEMFKSLLSPSFEFHLLQKEVRAEDAKQHKLYPQLKTHHTELADFSDTAALVQHMDLVISVDTSVAHVTAATGKACWILLPYAPDFRWMLDRDDSPWYSSVRLFRQPKFKDWESVIEQVRLSLMAYFDANKTL